MPRCIIAGCTNSANNNFSVRLRRPSTRAIWAPNTKAFICKEHATGGIVVTVELTPNQTGKVETRVRSTGGRTVTRKTPIVRPARD